jgi:major membrane immunogen (membrane-anchored lipoprotein)
MTVQDAIKKINKLFGFQKFNSLKLKDTEQELILEKGLTVGEPVYMILPNGQLPAKDGEYVLEDSTKIKIQDGKVHEIKYDMENKDQKFVEAKLKDGTVVESNTFDVGEEVSVVSPDGNKSPAPDGEHELSLKDSSGNEVVIRIITKDGKIVERMNVEEKPEEMGMLPELSVGNDIIEDEFKKKMIEKMEALFEKIEKMASDYEEMKNKVAKFSKEPAGEPVKQPKNIAGEFKASNNEKLNQLINIRAKAFNK